MSQKYVLIGHKNQQGIFRLLFEIKQCSVRTLLTLNDALFKVCDAQGLCLSMKVDHMSLKIEAIYLVLGQSWI